MTTKKAAGVLPWLAISAFAVVGAGIVVELVRTSLHGRSFAFVLELAFALVWLFIAAAYVQDVRKRTR